MSSLLFALLVPGPPGSRRAALRDRTADVIAVLSALVYGAAAVPLGDATSAHAAIPWQADVAIGIPCALALLVRRRWPLGLCLALLPFGVISVMASGPVLVALFTVAIRRRTVLVLGLAAAHVGTGVLYYLLQHDPPFALWVDLVMRSVTGLAAVGWGMFLKAYRHLTSTLRGEAANAQAQQQLRMEQARLTERARIAREMHDVLAHRMSMVSLHAGALEVRTDARPDEIATAARAIRVSSHEALEELRAVIGVLRHNGGHQDEAPDSPDDDGSDRRPGTKSGFNARTRMDGRTEPGRMDGATEPGRMDGATEPGRVEGGTLTSRAEGRSESGRENGGAGIRGRSSGAGTGRGNTKAGTSRGRSEADARGGNGQAQAGPADSEPYSGRQEDGLDAGRKGDGADARGGVHAKLASVADSLGGIDRTDGVGIEDGGIGWSGMSVRPEPPQPRFSDLPDLLLGARSSGARIDFAWVVPRAAPSQELERTVYRVVQEALTNARKHAPGSSVEVLLDGGGGRGLRILVTNSLEGGHGERGPRERVPGSGTGLIGVGERVALVGGRVEYGAEGDRFRLEAWLPWHE